MLILLALTALASSIGATEGAKPNVTCIFNQYGLCYNKSLSGLGAIPGNMFIQQEQQLNKTCGILKNETYLFPCLHNASIFCKMALDKPPREVQSLLATICTNGSQEYKTFLNSSRCYNDHRHISDECIRKNRARKDDSKALCCSVYNIQKCIEKNIKGRCPPYAVNFRSTLLSTYNSYAKDVCSPKYWGKKECNGCSMTNAVNVLVLGLVAFLVPQVFALKVLD